jgi:hypothetical protein
MRKKNLSRFDQSISIFLKAYTQHENEDIARGWMNGSMNIQCVVLKRPILEDR